MAGAVVRVKRRLDEDPADALLLSYKRRKTNDRKGAATQALIKFVATVKEKNIDTIRSVLSSAKTKIELKDTFKTHTTNIANRQRQEHLDRSKANRFKILSCNRAINENSVEECSAPLTIVDVGIEDDPKTIFEDDRNHEIELAEPNYVYDLYSTDFMPEEADFYDGYFESSLSVEPFKIDMQYRGSEDSEEINSYGEDEDSNDENNSRNDYPDSDPDYDSEADELNFSFTEGGTRRVVNMLDGMRFGEELSSDSEDERYFATTGTSPPRGFEAFKQKILQQEKKAYFVDVLDDDNDDGSESSYQLNDTLDENDENDST